MYDILLYNIYVRHSTIYYLCMTFYFIIFMYDILLFYYLCVIFFFIVYSLDTLPYNVFVRHSHYYIIFGRHSTL